MKKIGIFLSMLLCTSMAFAQQTYTIKVVDARTGNPISNASIKLSGANTGTVSGIDGMGKIKGLINDMLEISSIGYKNQVVTLGGQTSITIAMEPAMIDFSDVVVIGTRGAPRARTETAVPVDVIKINQVGLPTAKMELTSVLNMAAPSFNYNKQSGADGADHVDLGTLRGLGPDQTLVLINGKRRHQTAFVGLFGTRGRGNSGVDLNAFPEAAVDRIEILRDGASAQYGSDAMAGVINIILKKDINHWSINTGWSGYYDNKFNAKKFNDGNQYYSSTKMDGNTFAFSVSNGFNLGKHGGFVSIAADFLTQGKTYRQVDTGTSASPKNILPYINPYRRAFGDGSVTTGGVMYNMELPCEKSKMTFYSFGGYNYKSADAFAYTRNYSARPERFPIDMNGNLVFDGNIMHVANDGEIYYNPHIQTHIQDISMATGVRGKAGKGWNWDLSNTIGRNDFHYYGDKTFNASMIITPGTLRQTHFNDGGFNFLQNTTNLDVSKSFPGVAEGMNLGMGAEFRYERYSIYKGERASYDTFPNPYMQAAGAQGFPGFSPSDEVQAHRSTIGAYVDAEINVTKAWLADGAIRFENYSDFGSVATFKFATRYKVLPGLNVRGSVSTGFRAPSLQQINFSNTLTSFSGGKLVQSRIASNNSSLTRAAGIPKLKEESSVNASLGFSWKPLPKLTITMDGYWVKVKDRVVLSGLFSKFDATLPVSFTSQFPADVATAQFFDNAVNTSNYGLDVVVDYSVKWNKSRFKALLAANIQHMTIDAIHVPTALNGTVLNQKTFFSDREEAFVLASAPKEKFSLNLEYGIKKFAVGTNLTYYGKVVLMGFGDATADNPNQTGINPMVPTDADPNVYVPEVFNFRGKLVADIYGSYKISKRVSFFAGVDNVFNTHPDLGVNPQAKGWFADNESGGAWDSVQMGFNGMRVFGKLSFNFGK